MKRLTLRSMMSPWTRRTCFAIAAGIASAGAIDAQESRSLSRIVQPARHQNLVVASPDWALQTALAVDSTSTESRVQAVGVLGTIAWQSDAELENAMVRALRADPTESVRVKAAAVLGASRYLTPLTHSVLQHCQIGSSQDGFLPERSPGVKWAAGQALHKHPTSADPRTIAAAQAETARRRILQPTLTLGTAPTTNRDGAEESSPPVTSGATLGRPVPTDVPIDTPISATPCACSTPVVESPPAPSKSFLRWPFQSRRETPASAAAVTVVNVPMSGAAPTPMPTPGAANPTAVQTVSTPSNLPPVMPIPTTDRQPPQPESTLPEMPLDVNGMSLSERRAELRQMGLHDSMLRVFAEQVGAPPPTPPTTSDSPGLFRRFFGGSRTTSMEQMPRSSESMGVTPISNQSPLRTP